MFVKDSSSLSKAGILIQMLGIRNVRHSSWTVREVPAFIEGFMHIREGGKWFLDYPFEAKHLSDTFDQNIVAVSIFYPI